MQIPDAHVGVTRHHRNNPNKHRIVMRTCISRFQDMLNAMVI